MASSKPAVVIVPGAWHPPALYETLETALDKAGYTALTASLPSLDSQDPQATSCSADADTVRQYIMRLIETDGKDVVVLCHSYGGIPGGGAAHGLSKTSRVQRGQKGGVIGLVYLTAFVVPEKASLLQIMGGKHAPYLVPDKVHLSLFFRSHCSCEKHTKSSTSPPKDSVRFKALEMHFSMILTTSELRNW